MSRRLVGVKQAMAEAHVSRSTLTNWMRAGKVAWVRTAGGALRFYADTLVQASALAPYEMSAPEPSPRLVDTAAAKEQRLYEQMTSMGCPHCLGREVTCHACQGVRRVSHVVAYDIVAWAWASRGCHCQACDIAGPQPGRVIKTEAA